jgi:hypothetical protein
MKQHPLIHADSQAEQIYAVYPYKVGRPVALRAIQKALRTHDFAFLLERTQHFAQLRGNDKSFIPNPSTWFNQERFNDDPSTWTRGESKRPVQRENIGDMPITRR